MGSARGTGDSQLPRALRVGRAQGCRAGDEAPWEGRWVPPIKHHRIASPALHREGRGVPEAAGRTRRLKTPSCLGMQRRRSLTPAKPSSARAQPLLIHPLPVPVSRGQSQAPAPPGGPCRAPRAFVSSRWFCVNPLRPSPASARGRGAREAFAPQHGEASSSGPHRGGTARTWPPTLLQGGRLASSSTGAAAALRGASPRGPRLLPASSQPLDGNAKTHNKN